jgi:hypothetical protein
MLGLGIPAGVWTSLVLAAVALLAVMTILNRTRRALATGSR